MEVPRVAVSVDLVVLTVRQSSLCALVWRRHAGPHQGLWALPGGFIRLEEDLPATAARVLAERAGLPDAPVHLEQLRTYGYPDRDPRQRVVSVAYLGLAPDLPAPEQPQMSWQPVRDLTELAFDHLRILRDGVERARAKLEYTSLGAAFCRDEFTVAELRRVYEIVWDTRLDPRNFHRKVTGARRFLVETGSVSSSGGRPAQLYRRGSAELLHPPMLRPRSRRQAGPLSQEGPSPGEPAEVVTGAASAVAGGESGGAPVAAGPGGRPSPNRMLCRYVPLCCCLPPRSLIPRPPAGAARDAAAILSSEDDDVRTAPVPRSGVWTDDAEVPAGAGPVRAL